VRHVRAGEVMRAGEVSVAGVEMCKPVAHPTSSMANPMPSSSRATAESRAGVAA
jgi:hypothetical protein